MTEKEDKKAIMIRLEKADADAIAIATILSGYRSRGEFLLAAARKGCPEAFIKG